MLFHYSSNIYSFFLFQNYAPTTFNRYISDSMVANKRVRYTVWDTAGSWEPNTTRTLAYREADVFLLCYKISDPNSLFGAINHWVPELRGHAPATPILLVGCQSDLRNDRHTLQTLAKAGQAPVSSQQALAMSQQINAVMYVETSAKSSLRGVSSAMEVAALISFGQFSPTPSPQNTILPTPHRGPATPSPLHNRQSSLVPTTGTTSPLLPARKVRNRSLSAPRHRNSNDLLRSSLKPPCELPVSPQQQQLGNNGNNNESILSIEPSELFWDQFNSSKDQFSSPKSSPRGGGEDSPLPNRILSSGQGSPRSPSLASRCKMGSLSSMSMRSKSSTLSSTKSDSSMQSMQTNSTTPSKNVISISTKTPKQNRKLSTPDKSGGKAERMITIKCQRLTAERTYEEVEIEVPAPVYETMQHQTENGGSVSSRTSRSEKRSIGTKIKCLFSKTAS